MGTQTNYWARKSFRNSQSNTSEVFFDPASIAIYINIIAGVIKLYKIILNAVEASEEFKKGENSKQHVNRVKKITRKEMGFFRYLFGGKKYVSNIVNTMQDVNHLDMKELYREIGV